ncbi:hypothetical protein PENARI_c043G05891 [Penicillium arizonense]|uniref:Uncharacterized protein n=1 Tax=Penicillium arizonense TaxID=1835702 RepID=A0A1F5L2K2_PENAI|nr:hypothetical protein PENARI_c043G05891 [Penicillium arizonense]OGE47468.1 hypothetical protein PENARI_c043G05891 [Penicillium arizonense]
MSLGAFAREYMIRSFYIPTNLSKKSSPAIKATGITICGRIPESCDTACSAADIV